MTAILKVDTIQDTAGNNIINENANTVTIGKAGDTVNVVGTLQNNSSALVTGKILQVISADTDSATSTTSTSYVATALNVNITPSATSSKILVMATSIIDSEGTGVVPRVTLYRDTTELQNGLALNYSSAGRVITPVTLMKLDSPSSTSQLNYKVYLKGSDGNTVSFNSDSGMRGQIVAIEVGA